MKKFSYGKQSIDNSDIAEVLKVLKTDWLTQGPKVQEFENRLGSKSGAKYVSAVSNGTAALHLAGLALGWKKNDIVITSPITFLASANCVLYSGATPDFVDIDENYYTIDVNKLEDKVRQYRKKNKRIKAVVAVDYAGQPCDWKGLRYLADKYGFQLVNDNCHALGAVKVFVHDPLAKDNPATARTFERENVSVTIYGKQKFSPKVFSSAIAWKQGALTRQSLEQRTLENFGSTNLFSSISIKKDSVNTGPIPITIDLDPSPKHLIEPKLLVDNRYGSLFVGGSLAYENRNLFGAGQQLRLSTNYGTQTSSNTSVLSSLSADQYDKIIPYEFNAKAELVIPRLGKQGSFYSGTLEYAQSKQPVLLGSQREIIRGTYSTRPTRNSKLSFDFFELEVARKDSLRGFQQLFKTDLAENIGIDPADPVAVKRGLDSLLQTRLNQTFRLRYNYSNRDNASRRKKSTFWNFSAIAEESGSLLWLIDNFVDTKANEDFASSDAQIFGTPYNQYVKLDTQLAVTKELSPDRQVAAKVAIGWMSPYGKAQSTPEDHRFYAGGSNSMRGWVFGTLGPGNCSNETISNFGGDIKAELGLEYRMQLFKVFGQKSGVTLFTDAGNIWDRTGPYAFSLQTLTRDFAWDCGAGLRIGSPIGPFRFDFAWKLHDPADPDRWQFSKMKLTDFTFNFGIGEAF